MRMVQWHPDPNGGMLVDGCNSVEAGDYHSVYLKSDGTVLASGSNANGSPDGVHWNQLGSDRRMSPAQVVGLGKSHKWSHWNSALY